MNYQLLYHLGNHAISSVFCLYICHYGIYIILFDNNYAILAVYFNAKDNLLQLIIFSISFVYASYPILFNCL